MPIILTPLHFDRDALQKQPSCRRSVVIRTFITSDFMTGIPATPGNQISEEVSPRDGTYCWLPGETAAPVAGLTAALGSFCHSVSSRLAIAA